jgi:SPP1 family predicted phage head-tail adaptor
LNGLFIDPGAMRTELSLQQAELAPDGMGGHAQSWQEIATVFARIEPVAADARFGAGQTLEHVTHRITLRHRTDLASGMRFARGSRIFEIVAAHDPDETQRYLVCRCREEGR